MKDNDINFDELYQYVKKEILNYDESQALPSSYVLRLKGLREGKYMANKKIEAKANYSYEVILNTFKFSKIDILRAVQKKEFKSENQKFNYIMAIINNNINEVYNRMTSLKKQQDKIKYVEIDKDYNKANYKRKTNDKRNKMLKDMW